MLEEETQNRIESFPRVAGSTDAAGVESMSWISRGTYFYSKAYS